MLPPLFKNNNTYINEQEMSVSDENPFEANPPQTAKKADLK